MLKQLLFLKLTKTKLFDILLIIFHRLLSSMYGLDAIVFPLFQSLNKLCCVECLRAFQLTSSREPNMSSKALSASPNHCIQ